MQAVKNKKSPGEDDILNEYFATSLDLMIDIYIVLFNIVFDTGILPEIWLIGNVIPISNKDKCSTLEPKNYIPITLLSCLGKIFTSELNQRLTEFIEDPNMLNENQAGFRKDYSPLSSIIFLICII